MNIVRLRVEIQRRQYQLVGMRASDFALLFGVAFLTPIKTQFWSQIILKKAGYEYHILPQRSTYEDVCGLRDVLSAR